MDTYWETSYIVFLAGKDENKYCLSIKNGNVVTDDHNPCDLNQFWIKDYRSKDTDSEGCLAFSLVNKGTGQALQHQGGGDDNTQPTKLIQYNPNTTDPSTLFTEKPVPGSAHTRIRLQNYIDWNLYVLDIEVRQGAVGKVPTAFWKMEPQPQEAGYMVLVKPSPHITTSDDSYCLAIRNGKVVVVKTDPRDRNQYWIRDNRFSSERDAQGSPAFALFNKGTHEALQHQGGGNKLTQPTKLTKYNMFYDRDFSTLFTQGPKDDEGFRVIKLHNFVNWFLYVNWGSAADASEVCQSISEEPAKWKLVPVCSISNYNA